MIFTVPLVIGDPNNVAYKWQAGGVLGTEQTTGVSQVGDFALFRIDCVVPTGAQELIVYDTTDHNNFAVLPYSAPPAITGGGSGGGGGGGGGGPNIGSGNAAAPTQAIGGLTFGSQKDTLRLAVDNGVGVTDPRIMRRTNEATQELLFELIPVGGMVTARVQVSGAGMVHLPKELENSIDAFLVDPTATVNGSSDVTQSSYNIVNSFTYVDPSMAEDNPMIDKGLVPDTADPTILRRMYQYPGAPVGATVEITGKRRFVPIVADADPLPIQNVPALKAMIQAIEYRENGAVDDGGKLKAAAIEILLSEVRSHLLDPRNFNRRKANYEMDLVNYNEGTFGYLRARLALELPGALLMGKERLGRLLERSESRCLELGMFKGAIEEFTAPVVCGHIVMPQRVESILAAGLNGTPVNVRSIFFKYLENGPGEFDCAYDGLIEDEGDITMNDGRRRHKYRLSGVSADARIVSTSSSSEDTTGSTSGETITATKYLYIGSHSRLVALDSGVKLEVLDDDSGNWIEQGEWTE